MISAIRIARASLTRAVEVSDKFRMQWMWEKCSASKVVQTVMCSSEAGVRTAVRHFDKESIRSWREDGVRD